MGHGAGVPPPSHLWQPLPSRADGSPQRSSSSWQLNVASGRRKLAVQMGRAQAQGRRRYADPPASMIREWQKRCTGTRGYPPNTAQAHALWQGHPRTQRTQRTLSSCLCWVVQSSLAGELLATIITATTLIDGYLASLRAFDKTGRFPQPPSRTTPAGQTVVQASERGGHRPLPSRCAPPLLPREGPRGHCMVPGRAWPGAERSCLGAWRCGTEGRPCRLHQGFLTSCRPLRSAPRCHILTAGLPLWLEAAQIGPAGIGGGHCGALSAARGGWGPGGRGGAGPCLLRRRWHEGSRGRWV